MKCAIGSLKFEIIDGKLSDGYHTFDELYKHRHALFIKLCLQNKEQCLWKYDEHIVGWFILYWGSSTGQISYHLPIEYLTYIRGEIKETKDCIWDGHDSSDSIERLLK
jgi:hypothetical protein